MRRVPLYLMASALCCAIAISACNEGPTGVAEEASLSADNATLSAKKDKFDICHWDGDLNEGAGALVHITVNGNAWDGGGEGCGGKENPHGKQTGHNGHELDVNWNSDTAFVATSCEAFCYEDRDGDGLTDDQDPCIFDADNDSDADGVCLSDGDTCYADPNDSDGGTDADGDGICEEGGDAVDNCPDVPNTDQVDADADDFGAACDCDDTDPAVNPDATEVCNGIDDNCVDGVDEGDICNGFSGCADPQQCGTFTVCNSGGSCGTDGVCAEVTDGGYGVCISGSTSCGDLTACASNSDCNSDELCLVDTCCGTPVCIRPQDNCTAPASASTGVLQKSLIPQLYQGTSGNATIGSPGN